MQQDRQVQTPSEPQEAPQSARESIRAAMDEHKKELAAAEEKNVQQSSGEDAGQEADKNKDKKAVEQKPDTPKKDEQKPEELADKDDKAELSEQQAKKEDDKVEPDKSSEKKAKAPIGLPKEIRAEWDALSPSTQSYLSKVVKENHEIKTAEGRRTHWREVEQVLTPYMPEIQRIGASPAQVVKRLLDYSDALASPQHKYAAIASLANNYGIDLSLFSTQQDQNSQQQQHTQQQNTQQQNTQHQTTQQQNYQQIDPSIVQKLDTVASIVEQQQNAQLEAQRSANDKAALDYVNQWAGFNPSTNEYDGKPYFPHVRQQMFQLIYNGVIPMVNGQLDLDTAYETACYANPQIRELLEEDRENQRLLQLKIESEKKQQSLNKAKLAGSSIRSGAPALQRPNSPPKTMNGKPISVRDSIRQALSDMR